MANNNIAEEVKSKVNKALETIAYETFEQKYKNIPKQEQTKIMEDAVEWFLIHFSDY